MKVKKIKSSDGIYDCFGTTTWNIVFENEEEAQSVKDMLYELADKNGIVIKTPKKKEQHNGKERP